MTNNKKKIDLISIGAAAVFGLLLSLNSANMSYAQTTIPSSPAAIASTTTRTFTDDTGFTVDIPQGWVVQDYNNTTPEGREVEKRIGYVILAIICREDEALPAIGGGVNCEDASSPLLFLDTEALMLNLNSLLSKT
jgi:hypothetical protein